jgi:hypothetical protein
MSEDTRQERRDPTPAEQAFIQATADLFRAVIIKLPTEKELPGAWGLIVASLIEVAGEIAGSCPPDVRDAVIEHYAMYLRHRALQTGVRMDIDLALRRAHAQGMVIHESDSVN